MKTLKRAVRRRLLVSAAILSVAGFAFVADPVAALPDETSDGTVTVRVEIAPRSTLTETGSLPTAGFALMSPAAVAMVAVLGGALFLRGRRRDQPE